MVRRKSMSLALSTILLAIFITVTASPALASTAINPRLYGITKYQTSTAIANQFSNQTVSNVVLASGNDFADALSSSALAHKLNAPVLLVDKNTQLSKDALEYIEAHLQAQGSVYIIGGTGIIQSDFDSLLSSKGYIVKRLGGIDRYDTDQLVVDELNATSETVFIASGEGFSDALSISSFAGQTNSPILLTQTNSLPKGAQGYLVSKQPKQIYIAGGAAVVSSNVEDEIQSICPNATITRFSGQTRFDTASLAYNKLATSPKTIYIASGLNYPDALSGTCLASLNGDPILLIDPSTPLVPNSVAAYLSQLYKNGFSPSIRALGGPSVVPNEVVNNIVNLLNGQSQSPLFKITAVDPRLILGGPVVPLPNTNYWYNMITYKYDYSNSSFHSTMQSNLYNYILNPNNEVSIHNRAVELHSGITVNDCVYFQSELLRRMGFSISNSMANVVQFCDLLPKLGFKKDTNIEDLKPGDICITQGYSHAYTFLGWVNPGKTDYAYVCDNQSRVFGGQVYHVRKIDTSDPVQGTDAMAFFFYY